MRKNSDIFSRRLKELRGSRNKSVFGRFLGIANASTYHNYESGRLPDSRVVQDIAMRCGVSVDWLLGISDVKFPNENTGVVCEKREQYNAHPGNLMEALDVIGQSLGISREEVFDSFCGLAKRKMMEDGSCEKSA